MDEHVCVYDDEGESLWVSDEPLDHVYGPLDRAYWLDIIKESFVLLLDQSPNRSTPLVSLDQSSGVQQKPLFSYAISYCRIVSLWAFAPALIHDF